MKCEYKSICQLKIDGYECEEDCILKEHYQLADDLYYAAERNKRNIELLLQTYKIKEELKQDDDGRNR